MSDHSYASRRTPARRGSRPKPKPLLHRAHRVGGRAVAACASWDGAIQPSEGVTEDPGAVTCDECLVTYEGWLPTADGSWSCPVCRRTPEQGHGAIQRGRGRSWCPYMPVPVPFTYAGSARRVPSAVLSRWWRRWMGVLEAREERERERQAAVARQFQHA